MTDPIQRGQKITEYFQKFNELIQMKIMIIRSTTEDYKERSKKAIIEGALQKVINENKKSDKDTYNEKLKAVVDMPESI